MPARVSDRKRRSKCCRRAMLVLLREKRGIPTRIKVDEMKLPLDSIRSPASYRVRIREIPLKLHSMRVSATCLLSALQETLRIQMKSPHLNMAPNILEHS